jgi:hypothetical protein
MSNPDPSVVRQVVQNIDFWCQWDETFEKDATALRLFFQEHSDLLCSLFSHFLMLETKSHKPSTSWWQRWQTLRASLPEELQRSFLLGLAKRNEWYHRLSLQPIELQYQLDGLTREEAESEDGRFTFEIFLNADEWYHFARARTKDQKRGSEHQYAEFRSNTGLVMRQVARSHAWNGQTRLIQSLQPVAKDLHAWSTHYDYISLLSHGKWYDRLQAGSMTHVISHAACWALSEFKDQEVCDCLTSIAMAYARKKSEQPAYLFPSSFGYSSTFYEIYQDWVDLSPRELMAKYSDRLLYVPVLQTEIEKALRAFELGRYLLLVNRHRVKALDEEIVLSSGTQIQFLRLIPLVGG